MRRNAQFRAARPLRCGSAMKGMAAAIGAATLMLSTTAHASNEEGLVYEVAMLVGGVGSVGWNIYEFGQSTPEEAAYLVGYSIGGLNVGTGSLIAIIGAAVDDENTGAVVGFGTAQIGLGVLGIILSGINHSRHDGNPADDDVAIAITPLVDAQATPAGAAVTLTF